MANSAPLDTMDALPNNLVMPWIFVAKYVRALKRFKHNRSTIGVLELNHSLIVNVVACYTTVSRL